MANLFVYTLRLLCVLTIASFAFRLGRLFYHTCHSLAIGFTLWDCADAYHHFVFVSVAIYAVYKLERYLSNQSQTPVQKQA